eukprot:SAG11_NODE_37391_length_257_cov_0.651899_1_plen_24_part_10
MIVRVAVCLHDMTCGPSVSQTHRA